MAELADDESALWLAGSGPDGPGTSGVPIELIGVSEIVGPSGLRIGEDAARDMARELAVGVAAVTGRAIGASEAAGSGVRWIGTVPSLDMLDGVAGGWVGLGADRLAEVSPSRGEPNPSVSVPDVSGVGTATEPGGCVDGGSLFARLAAGSRSGGRAAAGLRRISLEAIDGVTGVFGRGTARRMVGAVKFVFGVAPAAGVADGAVGGEVAAGDAGGVARGWRCSTAPGGLGWRDTTSLTGPAVACEASADSSGAGMMVGVRWIRGPNDRVIGLPLD